MAATRDPPSQEMGASLSGAGSQVNPMAAGIIHPPASHSVGSWLAAPAHLPRPSPASCCAFAVVEDKINNPNWRLWLTALGERGGGYRGALEGGAVCEVVIQ